MDINERISNVIRNRLGDDYQVETRTSYAQYGLDNKSVAGLTFLVKSPGIETDPEMAKAAILDALNIEPLKPHVSFESETNHLERLANDLAWIGHQEANINEKTSGSRITSIPQTYPKWFTELPKRRGSNQHALRVEKRSTGIIDITINVPSDIDSALIVKNLEGRKEAILASLAERTVKYTPGLDSDEKKAALTEAVKKLHMVISTSESDWGKDINIQFLSDLQLQASKTPNGFDPEKTADYVASNPLAALQDGDDDRSNAPGGLQPHLKKALARAILHAGENYNEVFPYIAGKEDMHRAVSKALVKLKMRVDGDAQLQADNSELVQKIDAFLQDPVFKDQDKWNTPVEKQEFVPTAPRFSKKSDSVDAPYEQGVMVVDINLPPDKFPQIQQQLAALDTPAIVPDTATTQVGAVQGPGQVAPDLKQALAQAEPQRKVL